MNHSIELLRQAGLEVVADALRFRPIDDTDGALRQRVRLRGADLLFPQQQDEVTEAGLVEERLNAVG